MDVFVQGLKIQNRNLDMRNLLFNLVRWMRSNGQQEVSLSIQKFRLFSS